jgi:hypothetical protein
MRNRRPRRSSIPRSERYVAVRYYGPDPTSSRFDRCFERRLKNAITFASSGVFGTVSDVATGETVYRSTVRA